MEKQFNITYKEVTTDTLNNVEQLLLAEAIKALEKAYSPYSKFSVGCSILLENGEIVSGGNQEVASYPVSICAEGVALSTASSIHPGAAIKAVFIVAKNAHGIIDDVIAPCGVCRQRLSEYEMRQKSNITIYMKGKDNTVTVIDTVKTLLPFTFTAKHLQ